MQLHPRPAFFSAVRKARDAGSDLGGEKDDVINAVLKRTQNDSDGISYEEFDVCRRVLQSADPGWSASAALDGCRIEFEKPALPERNPELEARVQRLKKEQANRQYKAMVKNVDHGLLKDPNETIGAQLKQVRVQVTNVVQLVLTVVGSFVFAYKLLEYNLDGATLIDKMAFGVATALLVGLCDVYFILRQMCADDAKLADKKD